MYCSKIEDKFISRHKLFSEICTVAIRSARRDLMKNVKSSETLNRYLLIIAINLIQYHFNMVTHTYLQSKRLK